MCAEFVQMAPHTYLRAGNSCVTMVHSASDESVLKDTFHCVAHTCTEKVSTCHMQTSDLHCRLTFSTFMTVCGDCTMTFCEASFHFVCHIIAGPESVRKREWHLVSASVWLVLLHQLHMWFTSRDVAVMVGLLSTIEHCI